MGGVFLLARRYIAFHRWKTATVVACVTLTIYLPVAVQLLINDFDRQLTARAIDSPLVVGAKGSRFDLALHAMYFEADPPEPIAMSDLNYIVESDLASAIPLFVKFRARENPIVGTSIDYFSFRQLTIAKGTQLTRLGDCVLGASVAERLGLQPNDRLMSDPENIFDLAGSYPLNMRVVGILNRSHSPDDEAVFVDIKTAWIIAGIGHGHEDLAKSKNDDAILERSEDEVVANAALVQYTEITDENADSFHFHGEPDDFPLTAVIAEGNDEKSETLLMGRYLSPDSETQILRPVDIVDELMRMVFRVKRLIDAAAFLLGVVTLTLLALVVTLSLRLRKREMETMFKLGCSRFTIFWLQATELVIVLVTSGILAAVMSVATLRLAPFLMRALIV